MHALALVLINQIFPEEVWYGYQVAKYNKFSYSVPTIQRSGYENYYCYFVIFHSMKSTFFQIGGIRWQLPAGKCLEMLLLGKKFNTFHIRLTSWSRGQIPVQVGVIFFNFFCQLAIGKNQLGKNSIK